MMRKHDGKRKETERVPAADPLQYATRYHAPVLCDTVIELLVTDRQGRYVDGTLGGGGHTAALLDALDEDGQVYGIDQDADALKAVRSRLAEAVAAGRLHLLQGNFGDLEVLLTDAGAVPVAGLLLDLGVSSHQIDTAERGFSFSAEGTLDMRMDARGGLSAYDVVNAWPVADLRRVLRQYGEERRATKIARAIEAARPLETTAALAGVVRGCVPRADEQKTLARVFQAIRIVVNDELAVLEKALAAAGAVVAPGGRAAVISYHSLEDRRVKRYFRYGNLEGRPVRDHYGNLLAPWRELTRRPVQAGEAEVQANPRARSARLRVAERQEAVQQ